MRVIDYLEAKYGVGSATTILHCEARALGIPYPPPSGWLRNFGPTEITADAAERLRSAIQKSTKLDHIKPRRLFPELALVVENLQVLCGDCNEGKGNWDMTDARGQKHS